MLNYLYRIVIVYFGSMVHMCPSMEQEDNDLMQVDKNDNMYLLNIFAINEI
jgi:hypothetical protein